MSPDVQGMKFYTVAEVAELIRVSKMTVYRMVNSGELPAVRFGRSFRVPEYAVRAVVDLGYSSDAGGAR